jgi:hypothetical protein
MSTIAQMPERPPLVQFFVHPVETNDAEGHRSFKDVDFVRVTPPGGNLVVERDAREWLEQKRAERNPFYDHFKRAYDGWKEGQEPPVSGTPLTAVSCFTPAEVKMLQAAGIRSVEDLAAFPDGQLGKIGMGAVTLKNKGRAWLEASQSAGKVAEELAALRTQLETLVRQNTEKDQQIKQLAAELQAQLDAKPKRGREAA